MVTGGEIPAIISVDFESFYVQTGRRMLSVAYSLTGSWSDAEDLVQEARRCQRSFSRYARWGHHDSRLRRRICRDGRQTRECYAHRPLQR